MDENTVNNFKIIKNESDIVYIGWYNVEDSFFIACMLSSTILRPFKLKGDDQKKQISITKYTDGHRTEFFPFSDVWNKGYVDEKRYKNHASYENECLKDAQAALYYYESKGFSYILDKNIHEDCITQTYKRLFSEDKVVYRTITETYKPMLEAQINENANEQYKNSDIYKMFKKMLNAEMTKSIADKIIKYSMNHASVLSISIESGCTKWGWELPTGYRGNGEWSIVDPCDSFFKYDYENNCLESYFPYEDLISKEQITTFSAALLSIIMNELKDSWYVEAIYPPVQYSGSLSHPIINFILRYAFKSEYIKKPWY